MAFPYPELAKNEVYRDQGHNGADVSVVVRIDEGAGRTQVLGDFRDENVGDRDVLRKEVEDQEGRCRVEVHGTVVEAEHRSDSAQDHQRLKEFTIHFRPEVGYIYDDQEKQARSDLTQDVLVYTRQNEHIETKQIEQVIVMRKNKFLQVFNIQED